MPPVVRATGGEARPDPARRPRRAGRRGRPGAACRSGSCTGTGPGPKAPLPDRWIAALTAADPTLPGRAPGRGARAGRGARRLDAGGERGERADPGQLPAERAAARRRRVGARVRAAVGRGSEPLPAGRRAVGRAAASPGLPPRPGRDAAGRARPRGPAVPAAARGAARPGAGRDGAGHRRGARVPPAGRARCCRRPASACSCRPGPGARASGSS